jgi:citrate synthase
LEQVASLLWAAEESERERLFHQPCPLPPRHMAQLRACTKDPLVVLHAALPVAGEIDLASYDLRPAAVRQAGARILRLMTSIITGTDAGVPAHLALQNAWAPGKPAVAEAIRTALVLCADHELNVSAFTARCVASAGASPYDVVSAAIAALKGSRHGGETGRLSSLFAEIQTMRQARTAIAERLRRGESLPGFGQPLYPDGDPRAALLMRLAESSGNRPAWKLLRTLAGAARDLLHDAPNLDFGLVALARAYDMPERAPLLLFALGRTTGWIAHAIEQYGSSELIRPRANYTGPAPL